MSLFILTKLKVARETRQYQWLCESFFPLMTVFYHYQFRSKKSLELSLDWLKTSKCPRRVWESRAIPIIGQQLIDSRREMCEYILVEQRST
jgi:hypothetical protein